MLCSVLAGVACFGTLRWLWRGLYWQVRHGASRYVEVWCVILWRGRRGVLWHVAVWYGALRRVMAGYSFYERRK